MAYYRDGYGLLQRLRNLDGIISHFNSLHKVSLSTDDKELTKQNFKMFLREVQDQLRLYTVFTLLGQ